MYPPPPSREVLPFFDRARAVAETCDGNPRRATPDGALCDTATRGGSLPARAELAKALAECENG